jgi:phosphomevalonate kinase
LRLPHWLGLTFIYTGKSASTADYLVRVDEMQRRSPSRHAALLDRMTHLAHDFAIAFDRGDAPALFAAANGYHDLMAELGRAISADVVTPLHAQLNELAREAGAASKPSGAGGGDLHVVFSEGVKNTLQLRTELGARGFRALDISIPSAGFQLEP